MRAIFLLCGSFHNVLSNLTRRFQFEIVHSMAANERFSSAHGYMRRWLDFYVTQNCCWNGLNWPQCPDEMFVLLACPKSQIIKVTIDTYVIILSASHNQLIRKTWVDFGSVFYHFNETSIQVHFWARLSTVCDCYQVPLFELQYPVNIIRILLRCALNG